MNRWSGSPFAKIGETDTFQEECGEREWRRRELERLSRRKALEAAAQEERRKQVALREQEKAIEAQRDRDEFYASLQ